MCSVEIPYFEIPTVSSCHQINNVYFSLIYYTIIHQQGKEATAIMEDKEEDKQQNNDNSSGSSRYTVDRTCVIRISLLPLIYSSRYRPISNIIVIALISGMLFCLLGRQYTVSYNYLEKQQVVISSQSSLRGRDIIIIKYICKLLKQHYMIQKMQIFLTCEFNRNESLLQLGVHFMLFVGRPKTIWIKTV